jgi:hypothetical protein
MSLLLPDIILLTQREHERLNNQVKRLQRYDLDVDVLEQYRQGWADNLGYQKESLLLLQAVDRLIESLELGEYDQSLYDEVCIQIDSYKGSTWTLLKHLEGSLSPYMDRWAKVYSELKDDFRARYEPNKGLSVHEQGMLMRSFIEPRRAKVFPAVKGVKDRSGSLMDRLFGRSSEASKKPADVIDFASYKSKK